MQQFTPQEFSQRWQNTTLSERASYQLHFNELCQMVGVAPPDGSGVDQQGRAYVFERAVKKDSGGQGFADVYYENHFAIEYKAPGKYDDLSAAYTQLQRYRENLNNPPLLVVTDIDTWEIHTNWPNTEKKIYKFSNGDIASLSKVRGYLQAMFEAPERLHPGRNTEQVTADAADVFQVIADNMRDWQAEPERIAHFLTKLVFCLFAEDVSLLPLGPGHQVGIFSEIVQQTRTTPSRFTHYLAALFEAMADGGEVMFASIPYFNGTLFDDVRVEELQLEALTELERAARLNWSAVEPAIFGTLFERSLDPGKRAQLGAHYTSRDDILLIVEPVLMQPLRRAWAEIRKEALEIRPKYEEALKGSNRRTTTTHANKLESLRGQMLARLREVTVLDPACGSGNFLYVSLQLLMDLEKAVITDPVFAGLTMPYPQVHPRQMYGIELDPIAHALASIVVWIGYLQWRQNNGYLMRKEPILEDLHENIQHMDAIMTAEGTEPDWPAVDVIVSNPPFLGDKKMRGELGGEYVDKLRALYEGRVPGGADLVTYWFEKSHAYIAEGKLKRVGLLSTNSIRQGANRDVLKRVKDSGDLFMAWSDREWILEGAAVRVSMVGFDDGSDEHRTLNGERVSRINSDLTHETDVTEAVALAENKDLCFLGVMKSGPFDIDSSTATKMLKATNPSGVDNAAVVKKRIGGQDVVRFPRDGWIIDFVDMPESEAVKYELPFAYVREHVKPQRDKNTVASLREKWWLHGRPRPAMREAMSGLSRYIGTSEVSKHRTFIWIRSDVVPDHTLHVIAREDDYFFGVLHSKLHEIWSLKIGSYIGAGNDPRYTSTKTFETFPFPWPPGSEDRWNAAYQAISGAAATLHEERDAWLNPAGVTSEKALRRRTLTNLYNALAVWRGTDAGKVEAEAADFAARLDVLHRALDKAVCAAYGWDDLLDDDLLYTAAGEEAVLSRLLALNLARAGES